MRTFAIITPYIFVVSQHLLGQITFEDLHPEQTGVHFVNRLIETPQINVLTYPYYHNGGGVCVGDLNGDELPDLYFTSNMEQNALYVNKGGMKFENVTPSTPIHGDRGWATGACFVDINQDGLLDIYVCKSGNLEEDMRRNKLYINKGNLQFEENAADYGLDDPSYSTQAYFLDYDLDGDLDMYLLNHPITPYEGDSSNAILHNLPRDPNAGDKLFRCDSGRYVDVSQAAGIEGSPISYGLSVSIGDYNNDGYPDMYVCNDFMEHDYLYMNNRDGTFTDKIDANVRHISNFSMGSDVGDINNDGLLDIMVADMAAEDNFRSKANMSGMNPERFWKYVNNDFHYQYMINTLQLNNGNGEFSEIAQLAGVDKTDWSWAPLFADFNNDGLQDLFVTNGLRKEARNNDFVKRKKKYLEKMERYPDSVQYYMRTILDDMPVEQLANYLFTNKGNLTFDNTDNTGLERPTFSNGAAYADLDNDGDLDLVVNNIDHPAAIYRNITPKGNYLNIRLEGPASNPFGIGARITVVDNERTQYREHYVSRGYLSSSDPTVHVGIGAVSSINLVEVVWHDGSVSRSVDVDPNQTITLRHKEAVLTKPYEREIDWINTQIGELDFRHVENAFDDFDREVLLPHRMSTQGPAIAVADVNNDGREDFYVAGAVGQSGSMYLQGADGTFIPGRINTRHPEREESAVHFFDADGDKDLDMYIGYGGNEFENGSEQLKDELYLNNNGAFELASESLPDLSISTGCVSSCDVDNDGDLDLFIGNRLTPGKYPFASPSFILINKKGSFFTMPAEAAPDLENLGMVTNVIWNDVNDDGSPDLILSGEWMPITILEQHDGKFLNRTAEHGLKGTEGWWFGMTGGDIDGDGDIDLIGGNLGLNYKYHATQEGPFQVYSEDINGDGKNDIVLGYNQDGKTFPLRGRQCSSEQIPEIKEAFPTYTDFASATLQDVYGQKLEEALHMSISDFSSCLFINDEGEFVRKNFRHDYQLFNWNSVHLLDVNGDGELDLVTAGNLHEAEVETPRCDAGNGLVLLGDGNFSFNKVLTTQRNWGQGNVKTLAPIVINGKQSILVGTNDGPLKVLTFE